MEQVLSESRIGEENGGKWNGSSGTQKFDKEIDLKGKICPYTFIESMLALELSFHEFKVEKNPHCHLCGENPTIKGLIDYAQTCPAPMPIS